MSATALYPAESPWSLATKIAFRFFFLYFIFYTLPFPIHAFDYNDVTEQWVEDRWTDLANEIAPWFGVEEAATGFPTGSGDKSIDYVIIFLQLVLAALGAMLWSVLDRKRPTYAALFAALWILLRYYVAYMMLTYGFYKIFKLQFPFPSLYRLVEPYGDSSPMGLAWTYMGYSDTYTWFAGSLEILGGLLLLFRRTATLGALVTIGVMGNVFMMNMSYDIPVKLFSFHLLLMAVFVMLPDMRRLLNLLLLNRPTAARDNHLSLPRPWMRVGRYVLKVAFIGYVVGYTGFQIGKTLEEYGENAPRPAHYGIYDVTTFVRNSDTIPPLTTDASRWSRIIVNYPGVIRTYDMQNRLSNYRFEMDTTTSHLSLTSFSDSSIVFSGSYLPVDSLDYEWTGMMGEDTVQVALKRFPETNFRLVNRGFHWVNEIPYNR